MFHYIQECSGRQQQERQSPGETGECACMHACVHMCVCVCAHDYNCMHDTVGPVLIVELNVYVPHFFKPIAYLIIANWDGLLIE